MSICVLEASQVALLIVDMQERLLAVVDQHFSVLNSACQLVKAFQCLNYPIFISEQYPQGLGETAPSLQSVLAEKYKPWIKSTFSCLDDPHFAAHLLALPYTQWIVVGLEAHICVLQTVKGLLQKGKQVVVLRDVISSRSSQVCSNAVVEMRESGARVSHVETILFELLKDSKHPQFKAISHLVKEQHSH